MDKTKVLENMSKITEIIDSLNDENVSDVKSKLAEEATALNENNRQLYTRAKKAEGFEYNKETKEWTKKEKPAEKKPDVNKSKSSNEPDYSKIAFLEGRKVSHPDDQNIVMEEAERLKLPLTDILGMKHIKGQLADAKKQRDATAGAPKGRGSTGSGGKGDVDYWLAKGETPDDQELAEKVIDARIAKSKSSNQFADDLY